MKTSDEILELVHAEMDKFYENLIYYELNIKLNLNGMRDYCMDVSTLLEETFQDMRFSKESQDQEKMKICCQRIFDADAIVSSAGKVAGELLGRVSWVQDHIDGEIAVEGDGELLGEKVSQTLENLESIRKTLGIAQSEAEKRAVELKDKEDLVRC